MTSNGLVQHVAAPTDIPLTPYSVRYDAMVRVGGTSDVAMAFVALVILRRSFEWSLSSLLSPLGSCGWSWWDGERKADVLSLCKPQTLREASQGVRGGRIDPPLPLCFDSIRSPHTHG